MLSTNYNNILKEISPNRELKLNDPIIEKLIKSAFLKNVEFNHSINSFDSEKFYFLIPFLRGLVEDIIVLNYLNEIIEEDDREAFIVNYIFNDISKAALEQDKFFEKERNHQPRVTPKIIKKVYPQNPFKSEVVGFKSKYSWDRKSPSVFQMAKDGGLKEVYEYFYFATSRMVHFNPQLLFKLGWGNSNSFNQEDVNDVLFNINTSNFSKYYAEFCRFYGSYLFIKFIEFFNSYLFLSEAANAYITEIKGIFQDNRRWPELLSFEELNIPLEEGIKIFFLEKGDLRNLNARIMMGGKK